jgi:hypothetical protein
MDKSPNVLNLQFADYTPISPREKVDRAGWVNFGEKNLFPQYLRELAETSPVHGSLCISIADMIAGKGVDAGTNQERVDALNVSNSFYGCAHDWKQFGGYYLEVIYSTDRKTIAKINHLPFEECRIAIEEESEDITGIFHSEDWSAIKKKRNKPVYIPKFNSLKSIEQPRQVYWCFNYTSGQVYPRPDYWSAVNYIELSKQIGIYHVNNIMNGLFPSFIVSFFQGQQDPDTQRKIANDWENKLSGARNAGKFIMTFNEPDHTKPEITAFPISDADKQYEFLSETSRKEIMVAHRITTPLLFGIREQTGFGSNKDEMVAGLKIFMNQVIEPAQRKLIDGFEEILSFEIENIELDVVQNTPISIEDATAEVAPATSQATTSTDDAAPVEETNVAATALNGAQISSLVEILIQTSTGIIPKDSAKGVVQAAFPTLSQQQIDAIFNSIVVGSVNPTEVALDALKLTMSELQKKKVVTDAAELAEESYQPTDEMAGEAELGLKWRKEFGRGGTMVGVARARDISNKKNLSLDTVKRMHSYFSRHEVDKQASGWKQGEEGFPSGGRIAWQLWGGDAGQSWAQRIVERVKKEDMSDNDVAEFLIECGDVVPENYILVDAFEVDYEMDDQHEAEVESLVLHEFATRVVPATSPNQISEQDKRIDDKLFLTRYRYRGSKTPQRAFCKKMIAADLLYRKEDIVAAENKVVNSGWGPYGTDTYDIWKFKGGGNCYHFWQKEVYMSTLKSKVSLTSKQTRQVAVKTAEKYGYKVRNEKEVAQLPFDMDWQGFLADNPVWGRKGSAYKKK